MRLRGIAIALLVLLAVPPTAWAQLRDKKAAAQHFKEGRALYDQSRWAEALAEFQSGYEAFPLPGFLVNMGQCFRKLERLEEARDAWQKFIESNPGDGRLRYEVDEALAEVRGELDKRTQDEAERQRVAESKRRALIESIARQQQSELQATAPRADLSVRSVPASNGELHVAAAPHKKSRWWVWTIVGVVAAGAVASAVTVGVIYGQPSGPQPGSFGLLDGRR